MGVQGVREHGGDNMAGDPTVGGDGDRSAGVVVKPVEDLDVAAVGEPPVREVGLPALVRQIGLEADVGGPRSFLRFHLGQTGPTQDPIHRR